jgi:hypothetical protein
MSAAADARAFWRYVSGLPRFLRNPVEPAEAERQIERRLARREESFLTLVEHAIFGNPVSPYRRLLGHLGIEAGDVRTLLGDRGLEGALAELQAAGAYVRMEEVRGEAPIARPGFELEVSAEDFSNPLTAGEFETGSGGSSGSVRRIPVDFDLFRVDAGYNALFRRAHGLTEAPTAIWSPVPPGHAGINNILRYAAYGQPPERWFSQYRWGPRASSLKYAAFTAYAVWGSRLFGRPLPRPEHVPLDRAERVAEWLAEQRAAGRPGLLEANCSSSVRACLASLERGLDISGTYFRVGGEPFTEAKAAVFAEAGARSGSHYSMGEIGRLGIACANPATLDDCHLAADKVAAIERPRRLGEVSVPALHLTTLHPSAPTICLNMESDDYGVIEERECGCAAAEHGLTTHVHSIRSYGKLSTEGMNFLGPDLLALVEEHLPSRFGGGPTHYQLAEREEGALSLVEVVVSPRVGDLDEDQVVSAVLSFLEDRGEGQHLMADRWRQAATLRLARREPAATAASKILPLELVRDGGG